MKFFLFCWIYVLIAQGAGADFAAYREKKSFSTGNGTYTFRHFYDWSSENIRELFLDLTRHEKFFSAENEFAWVEVLDTKGALVFRSPSPALTYLWISSDSRFFVGLSDVMLYNPCQLTVWRRKDGTLFHCEHISAAVAKLSPEQLKEFFERFPETERFLASRLFTHGGQSYLDYSLLGMPDEIGREAWDFLYPFRVKHPYADDFGESVTNWIGWFDPENPSPAIMQQEDTGEWDLLLNSRGKRKEGSFELTDGKRMVIPLNRRRDLDELNRQILLYRKNPPPIEEGVFHSTSPVAVVFALVVLAAIGVVWDLCRRKKAPASGI